MNEKTYEKVQALTSTSMPTGAGASILGALTFNEWLALGGFVLALGGFIVNWYYQHERTKILRDGHERNE